jgi:acetyl-CoA acetyltransferase
MVRLSPSTTWLIPDSSTCIQQQQQRQQQQQQQQQWSAVVDVHGAPVTQHYLVDAQQQHLHKAAAAAAAAVKAGEVLVVTVRWSATSTSGPVTTPTPIKPHQTPPTQPPDPPYTF